MKNRISVYVGPPLARILENEKNVSGRLNQVAERYHAILKKTELPEFTLEERQILLDTLTGSLIDSVFIEYLHDEAEGLQEKIKPLSFSERIALIESIGF